MRDSSGGEAATETPGSAADRRRRGPWWIPPFLGRVPDEITAEQLSLLGLVALSLVFEYYDVSMLGSAAKYIRESFEVPQSSLGTLVGLVRFGAIPAVLLVPLADRIGRRRLFLMCVIGTSLATLGTAFAQSAAAFVVMQMAARPFLIAGSAIAFVIVAEEFPAQHRGWAIGILGAVGSMGFGLGALLFAAVEILPFGWRALYAVGAVPLLLLPMFRREIRETQRFQSYRARSADGRESWWRPFSSLVKRYPGRSLLLASVGVLSAASHGAAHGLLGDYVQTDRGWSPGQYSAMFILGGMVGIIGNTVAGRMADRFGRRRVAFSVLGLFPFAALLFYQGRGWWIAAAWIPLVFFTTGGSTIIRAMSSELFPTSSRGTATGALSLFEALGAGAGLIVVGLLTPVGQSNANGVSIVVFLSLIGALLALLLPETARRELETISDPDDAGSCTSTDLQS